MSLYAHYFYLSVLQNKSSPSIYLLKQEQWAVFLIIRINSSAYITPKASSSLAQLSHLLGIDHHVSCLHFPQHKVGIERSNPSLENGVLVFVSDDRKFQLPWSVVRESPLTFIVRVNGYIEILLVKLKEIGQGQAPVWGGLSEEG